MKTARSSAGRSGKSCPPTFLSVHCPNLNYTLSSAGIVNVSLKHNVFQRNQFPIFFLKYRLKGSKKCTVISRV